MKYTLVSLEVKQKCVAGYYKTNPEDPEEKPHRMVVFPGQDCLQLLQQGNLSFLTRLRMLPLTMEAEVVEHKLDGVYEYPNGRRTDKIVAFCRKAENGLYAMGFSPQEQIATELTKLRKVSE